MTEFGREFDFNYLGTHEGKPAEQLQARFNEEYRAIADLAMYIRNLEIANTDLAIQRLVWVGLFAITAEAGLLIGEALKNYAPQFRQAPDFLDGLFQAALQEPLEVTGLSASLSFDLGLIEQFARGVITTRDPIDAILAKVCSQRRSDITDPLASEDEPLDPRLLVFNNFQILGVLAGISYDPNEEILIAKLEDEERVLRLHIERVTSSPILFGIRLFDALKKMRAAKEQFSRVQKVVGLSWVISAGTEISFRRLFGEMVQLRTGVTLSDLLAEPDLDLEAIRVVSTNVLQSPQNVAVFVCTGQAPTIGSFEIPAEVFFI